MAKRFTDTNKYAKISNKEVREHVYNKYNGKCAYCGCDLTQKIFTIDHIFPKRRHVKNGVKGYDCIDNYNPCCASCNSSKASYEIEAWRKELSLKHKRLLRDSSSYRILNRFGLIKIDTGIVFYYEKI